MPGSVSRLPRMSGLMVFEAAARHLSFTHAAHEMNVTQAAVGQQVRVLEAELGVALFTRHHRGLELTEEGVRLHGSVAMGLECIANATEDICAVTRPGTRTGVTSAIATVWLVPRPAEFRALHPEIDVHIVNSDLGFHAVANRADCGIAFTRGSWPGFRSAFLREGHAFPVWSSKYLLSRPPVVDLEQLLDEVFLILEDNRLSVIDWGMWFASPGVRNTNRDRIKFNSLSLFTGRLRRAGRCSGWSLLADDLLERGALVRPIAATLRTPGAYYPVVADKPPRPEIEAFRGWLLRQFPLAKERRMGSTSVQREPAC